MLPEETRVPAQSEIEPVAEQASIETPAQFKFHPVSQLPSEPPRDPFWSYYDLALIVGMLVAALILVSLAAIVAALIWPSLRSNPAPLILPTNLAMYFFLMLILKLNFSMRYGKPVLRSLGWRMPDPKTLIYAIAAGAALPFPISGIQYLLHTPKAPTEMDQMMKAMPLVPFAIMAAVVAPFFEEVLFRGFLQPLFTRSLGVVFGVLLTAIIFGGVHSIQYSFVWQDVVAIGLVGVALGAMRVWTNSIVPTTIMHGCFNGLQMIVFAVSRHQ